MSATLEIYPVPHGSNGSAREWEIDEEGRRIKDLVDQIESLGEPDARELLHECLQSVLALHGAGLAKILNLVKNAGAAGGEVSDALLNDKFVRGLLLLHGLPGLKVESALEQSNICPKPFPRAEY